MHPSAGPPARRQRYRRRRQTTDTSRQNNIGQPIRSARKKVKGDVAGVLICRSWVIELTGGLLWSRRRMTRMAGATLERSVTFPASEHCHRPLTNTHMQTDEGRRLS